MSKPETMLNVWPVNGGDVGISLTAKRMKIHPLCRMFSELAPLTEKERKKMVADVKARGIKVPILLNKAATMIIDGYTRWQIADELGLLKSQVPIERFKGKDDEIESEILSRNLFRRHMTDEQRMAIASMVLGPKFEKEAAERVGGRPRKTVLENSISFLAKAGSSDSGDAKPIHVAAKLAEKTGMSQYKAEQAEKARKAGLLKDVVHKKTTLRKAAASAGKKTGTPKKEVSFEDAAYKKWTAWLNRFAPEQRRVMELVAKWIGDAQKEGGSKVKSYDDTAAFGHAPRQKGGGKDA
jgi:ParB-like chromosome segregation protein Spo0J